MRLTKDTVFLVDVDGVLRDNLNIMVGLYNEEFNTNLKVEDVMFYDCNKSFPLIQKELGIGAHDWFFRDRSKQLFLDAPAFAGAKNNIEKLRTIGKVIIATYQKSLENKMHTLQWLDDCDIPYDDIYFGKEKELVKCDFIIDDNVDFIVKSKAPYRILINAPYNQMPMTILRENAKCRNVARYESLEAFTEDLLAMARLSKNLDVEIFV